MKIKKRRISALFAIPIFVFFGCSTAIDKKTVEPDYLDFIRGEWTHVAELSSVDGTWSNSATGTWRCAYDADQELFLLKGEIQIAGEAPFEMETEYRRAPVRGEATVVSRESIGHRSHGSLKQLSGTEVESVAYEEDGRLAMRARSVFATNSIHTKAVYYDKSGNVIMTGSMVDLRND